MGRFCCGVNWTQDQRERTKAWFSYVGKLLQDRDFTFCRPSQALPIYWILATRLSPILPILNLAGNGKCVKNWNLRDRGTGAERDEKTVEEKNRIVSWFHFIFILLFSSCCSTFTPSATLLSEYLEQVILLPKILVQIVSSRLREVSYRCGLQSRWDKIETGFKRKHKKRQTASSQGKQS